MDRKYDVITLGEILLRLSTPINGRLAQGDTLMKHLGGAELNIASEIGQLGLKTAIISKIPNNLLAAFIKNQLNASRVSENYLIEDHSDDSRVGICLLYTSAYRRQRQMCIRDSMSTAPTRESHVWSMTESIHPSTILTSRTFRLPCSTTPDCSIPAVSP